jgi:hypothetical protein
MSGPVTPTREACRREIEALHGFFVAWYTGQTGEFGRMDAAIAPDFEMVTPHGDRLDRAAVLEMVRQSRDRYDPGAFEIDIEDVDLLDAGDGYAVARYEEWQTAPDGGDGRLSTVVFRPDDAAPGGLAWVTVHETWLEIPE